MIDIDSSLFAEKKKSARGAIAACGDSQNLT